MRCFLVGLCLGCFAGFAAAQNVPRAKDGHPDLTGIWNPDGNYSGDFTKALKARRQDFHAGQRREDHEKPKEGR